MKLIDKKEKIFIIGAGSNTLISDGLFDGVVIKLSKNFNRISLLGDDVVISGSAVLDKSLSEFATNNNLSGFESDEHIDHTSVTMTAGAGLFGGGTIAATRTFSVDSASMGGFFSGSMNDFTTAGTGSFGR